MKTLAYRLHFKTPFHLDEQGIGFYQDSHAFIRSDTLSAAILSAWKLLEPNISESYFESPPFKVSSTFPFFEFNHKPYYFLPRPMCSRATRLKVENLHFSKKIKKIEWLEKSIWEEIVNSNNGWEWDEKYCSKKSAYMTLSYSLDDVPVYALLLQEIEGLASFVLWHREKNIRINTDRLTNQVTDGALFDFARIHYDENAGLYFFVELNDGYQDKFEAALRLLGDTGIGADRSSGHGFFEVTTDENITVPKSKNKAIALSLVSPNPDRDMKGDWLEGSAYDLVKRGGWVAGTSYRKNAVRMFAEGSSFSKPLCGMMQPVTTKNSEVEGRLKYTVYRDGRGFFVGEKEDGQKT